MGRQAHPQGSHETRRLQLADWGFNIVEHVNQSGKRLLKIAERASCPNVALLQELEKLVDLHLVRSGGFEVVSQAWLQLIPVSVRRGRSAIAARWHRGGHYFC